MPLDTLGTVCTAAHPVCCSSKTFWLLTGPSGIGPAHLGPQIKVQSIDLEALSPFGYFGNGLYRFPPGLLLLKNFLVGDRSIGNRSHPP